MNTEEQNRLATLRMEHSAALRECCRQKQMLSEYQYRLQQQFAEITELHFKVLEQLSQTHELIAIINDRKSI